MPTTGSPDALRTQQKPPLADELGAPVAAVTGSGGDPVLPRNPGPHDKGGGLGIDIVAMMTSSAATGILGFVFWTVAARGYDTAEVGRASAIISSATLIAILANFSLGSLYERFLPLAGARTQRLVHEGTAFVACAALLFGVIFIGVGPRAQLFPNWVEMLLFPLFVAVLAI